MSRLSKETLECCMSALRPIVVRVEDDTSEIDFPKLRTAIKELRQALAEYEPPKVSDESKAG